MNSRDRDSLLHDALKRGTDGAAQQKEKVWRSVSSRISSTRLERKQDDMRKKQRLWLTGAFAATAVVLASVFFSLTPEGTALADRIVKLFVPEKTMNTQIEGTTETQNATLQGNTSAEVGYVIYIDSERYVKESAGGMDYYKALNQPEGYPPVQMEISQLTGETVAAAYDRLLKQAQGQFDVAEGKGQVAEPVKGWSIMAYDEDGSDAPYEDIYIVDNTKGGCFLIECKMFREAAEGHGARYYAMLKTFEVVNSSQVETKLPTATAAPKLAQKNLTWDDLALYGAKLGTGEEAAVEALKKGIEAAGSNTEPVSDETANDVGGDTRTVKWENGLMAIIRNGKLYSLDTADEAAVLPNGLHAGMSLADFTTVLGEPHEAIGAVAWGVGSNDNLIVVVENGTVKTIKVSLVE